MPDDAGSSLEARLRLLEDRFAIQDLVAAYCEAIDSRDLARFVSLFTDDAVLRHRDGVMRLEGRAAIEAYYTDRFAGYDFTYHYPHAVSLAFDGPGEAHGSVTGHAEMSAGADLVLAAIRYHDVYRRTESGWRFAERVLSFGYYMKLSHLASGFGDRLRKHYKGERLPADG